MASKQPLSACSLFLTLSALLLQLQIVLGLPRSDGTGSRDITNNTNPGGHWIRHGLIGQGPRQEHAVTSIGHQVYIAGGVAYDEDSQFQTLNRVEVYDVREGRWSVAAPIPQLLNHGNLASVDGKLYLLGALSGGSNWTAVPDAYVYHPFNDTWGGVAPMPNHTWRGSSAVGVYDGKVYLAGGMTLLEPYEGGHQNSVSMVSCYDTKTNAWNTDFPPLPEPRQHVGFSVVNSSFYVIGGRENGIYEYHNTVYAMDLGNPTEWKKLAPMPTARGSLSCSPIGYKIYCFGGEGNRGNPDRIFNETEVFDTRSNAWAELRPMEVPRHGTGATTVDGQVWIPGGGATTAFFPVGISDSFDPGEEQAA